HPTDMKVYCDLIPLPPKEVEQVVGGLQPGQVICVSNHVVTQAHIRLRHTFHAGATPEFGANEQPAIRQIDEKLLQELQALMQSTSPRSGSSEERLRKRIKELEASLAEKDEQIAKKDEQIALLSKLSVVNSNVQSMPSTLEIGQATVHNMHMPAAIALPVARVVESTPATMQVAQATPLNEAKFRALQVRVNRLPALEQAILK